MKQETKKKLTDIAEIIDAYRAIPRIMTAGYGYMLYITTIWFMTLPDPNNAQSAFISILWGAAAAVFGFYVNSGNNNGNNKFTYNNSNTDNENK